MAISYLRSVLQIAPLDIDPISDGSLSRRDLAHLTDIFSGLFISYEDLIIPPHYVDIYLNSSLFDFRLTSGDVDIYLDETEFDPPVRRV